VSKGITLRTENGRSGTNQDYFNQSAILNDIERDLAKRTSRVLVSALSTARARLKNEMSSVYGTNAEGLGARAASLVTQALTETRPTSSTETEAEQLSRISKQIASITLNLENEKLLQKAVSILSPSDALVALSSGLYDATLAASTPRNALVFTAQGDGGALNVKSLQYRSSAWTPDVTYQIQGGAGYRVLYRDFSKIVGSQVASAQISIEAPVLAKDGASILKEKFSSDANAPARQVQLLVRDAEGLNFSSVPALTAFSGSFGSGHKLYQVRRKTLSEEYVFDGVATFVSSLASFKSSPRKCYEGVCWTITKPAIGNAAQLEGKIKFSPQSGAGGLGWGGGRCMGA